MDDAKRERLSKSITNSYRLLREYREATVKLNKEYAGPMYGLGEGSERRKEKPLNLLKQAVSAYMTLLASNRPNVLLTTPKMELKPFAKHFQVGINSLLKEIQLENIVSQWVRDAFFWIGIVKVHMADTGQLVDEGDLSMDPGRPFASNIPLDDFVWDTNAKKFSECRFAADIYRMPVETLQESDQYSGEALKGLQATTKYGVNEERMQEISMGYETDEDEIEPMCDVIDVWLPRDGVIETYVVTSRSELTIDPRPIASVKWKGKELGPYKLLHFDEVSENVMPCSTAADLYPLHRHVNNMYRKNAAKTHRQKDLHAYSPAAADSADKMRRAADGEWVAVNDPKEINVVKQGGMDPAIHGFMVQSMDLFDRMAGGLQQMLGLGAATDTVGQEKITAGAASRREDHLTNRVAGATTSLVTDLAYLLWIDDYTELPARVEVDGLPGVSYDATWKPDDREGEFEDYAFEIDVYSMQYQGPGARIATINKLLGEVFIPLMPQIQQQGGSIDFAALTKMLSEMLNIPRLNEIVIFNSPPMDTPPPGQDGPRKPPTSNRTYTRKNVSGGNSANPDASKIAQMSQTPAAST